MKNKQEYYIPHGSYWPIIGSVGITCLLAGFASFLNDGTVGGWIMVIGLAIIILMVYGWFGTVIKESQASLYNAQVDKSFRLGMIWFIFSEVMFFVAFFGALYYARIFSVPWLDGEGNNYYTGLVLWPDFEASWPLINPPLADNFAIPTELVSPFGIPLLNTILLLTSGATITWAHHALKASNKTSLVLGMFLTVALGVIFLMFQAYEYAHAYGELNLKLTSGIYGSTFYMLTGFHGFHVTLGTIMLIVILIRCIKNHFTIKNHFAFEAVAWYWHFVDVVWLGLYIFVYWL